MQMIVGLGNPGAEFEDTYHNAGFLALEALFPGASWKKYKNSFEYAEAGDVVLIRPATYMNESGRAVREAMKKYKVGLESLIVLQDDSDITVGTFKASFARSSAGHKGIQSIIDMLGSNQFTRIRIGIRAARETARKKAGEFALRKITPSHRKALDSVFEKIKPVIAAYS